VTVTVSDGALTAQQALFIDVGNVDEAPTFVTNVLLLSKDSATIVLLGTDPDTAASDLNYQASGQVGGRFELVAAPGVAVTTFSQAQVDAGAVRFVADGSGTGPAYVLSLSDGVSTVISGAPRVVVQASAVDVPAVVPAAPAPDPTPDPAPAATAAARAPIPAKAGRRCCRRPHQTRFRGDWSPRRGTIPSSRHAPHRARLLWRRPPHRRRRAIPP
jgi:Cadherin-like